MQSTDPPPSVSIGRRLAVGWSVITFACLVFHAPVRAGVNVWTSNGPEGGTIDAVAINPATPTTLYAASTSGSVFKSTNGGLSWVGARDGSA